MKPLRAALATLGVAIVALSAVLTATPGGAQASTSTLFGTTTSGAYKATYEPVGMYRAFFSGAPGDWATDPKLTTGKPINVSFKWLPATVLSGSVDGAIQTFFQTAPTTIPVWWTFYHEPENDIAKGTFTAADYKAAWQHIWTIAHGTGVYHANVHAALILMDYTVNPASGRNWLDYYPGDAYVDVLSWDVYNFKEKDADPNNNETIQAHMARVPSLAVTQAAGKPYAISEIGYDDAVSRPAFLTGLAHWAVDNNAVFVSYFDETGSLGDHRLSDVASQSLWRDAASGALFGSTPSAVDEPATAVTSTSATMSCWFDPHGGSYRVTVASWLTTGGTAFEETSGVVVTAPTTVSATRVDLTANSNYTWRCKVYDASNTVVLKPTPSAFTTTP